MSYGRQQKGGLMSRNITILDFLTEDQVRQAIACKDAKDICEKIIQPNRAVINQKLGQENDPMYLAYCCEFVFRKAGQWK
jgi:hypothetical protein